MDNTILSNIEITLYVVYLTKDETPIYYKGSTFYNVSEWSDDITEAFFFNHEPRPYEITTILGNSDWGDIGITDILIKSLSVSVNEQRDI